MSNIFLFFLPLARHKRSNSQRPKRCRVRQRHKEMPTYTFNNITYDSYNSRNETLIIIRRNQYHHSVPIKYIIMMLYARKCNIKRIAQRNPEELRLFFFGISRLNAARELRCGVTDKERRWK